LSLADYLSAHGLDALKFLDYAHLPVVDFSYFERAFNYVRSDVNKSALAKLRAFFGQGTASVTPSLGINSTLPDVPEDVSVSFTRIFKAYAPPSRHLAKWKEEEFISGWEELAQDSQSGLLSQRELKQLRKSTPMYLKYKSQRLFAVRSVTNTTPAVTAPTVDAFIEELNCSNSSISDSASSISYSSLS
jgi:hypothetical protein